MYQSKKLDWDDVRIFLAVTNSGSFRRTAVELGLGHTTLSRRLERLEAKLHTKLFNRLPTGLTLTSAGEEMALAADSLEHEFSELEVRMFGQDTEPKGTIKFTVPAMLLHLLLKPIVAFRKQWPDIQIEIDHSLDILNLSIKEADIALRMTNTPSDDLIGRRVGAYCEAAYATATYLAQHELGADHAWLYPGGGYKFSADLERAHRGVLQPVLTLPDPDIQTAAARQHLGVATLPCVIGERYPDLIRISGVVNRSGIWLLSHKDARGNRRMQLFRDFLIEELNRRQDLLMGTN